MDDFRMFGLAHIGFLIFEIAVVLLLYFYKVKIKNNPKMTNILRIGFAVLHGVFELSYYIWSLAIVKMPLLQMFPLELCAVGLYLTIFSLLFKNERLWRLSFPITMVGATLTLLVGSPDGYAFPHYRFFHFFGGHGLLIISNLFQAWVLGFKMKMKDLKETLIFFYLLILITFVVDWSVGANFMYLRELPAPVDVLGNYFGYFTFILEMATLTGLYILAVYLLNLKEYIKRKRRSANETNYHDI